MNVQELEIKVASAAEKVEKIKGTIAKHEASAAKKLAALAKLGITAENMEERKWMGGKAGTGGSANYWEICEVESKLNDAKSATRKLNDAEKILANWKSKLDVEVETDRFLNDDAPEVIKEFLRQWKEKAYEWHMKNYPRYVEIKLALAEAREVAKTAYRALNPNGSIYRREFEEYVTKEHKDVRAFSAALAMFGSVIATMDSYRNEADRLEYLEKTLEQDRKNKMLNLIYRVNEVVGTITDASSLKIDPKGNLNGIIVGTKGKAKVETIGAGGYNIQCFHFRTLVHELK